MATGFLVTFHRKRRNMLSVAAKDNAGQLIFGLAAKKSIHGHVDHVTAMKWDPCFLTVAAASAAT